MIYNNLSFIILVVILKISITITSIRERFNIDLTYIKTKAYY